MDAAPNGKFADLSPDYFQNITDMFGICQSSVSDASPPAFCCCNHLPVQILMLCEFANFMQR